MNLRLALLALIALCGCNPLYFEAKVPRSLNRLPRRLSLAGRCRPWPPRSPDRQAEFYSPYSKIAEWTGAGVDAGQRADLDIMTGQIALGPPS